QRDLFVEAGNFGPIAFSLCLGASVGELGQDDVGGVEIGIEFGNLLIDEDLVGPIAVFEREAVLGAHHLGILSDVPVLFRLREACPPVVCLLWVVELGRRWLFLRLACFSRLIKLIGERVLAALYQCVRRQSE